MSADGVQLVLAVSPPIRKQNGQVVCEEAASELADDEGGAAEPGRKANTNEDNGHYIDPCYELLPRLNKEPTLTTAPAAFAPGKCGGEVGEYAGRESSGSVGGETGEGRCGAGPLPKGLEFGGAGREGGRSGKSRKFVPRPRGRAPRGRSGAPKVWDGLQGSWVEEGGVVEGEQDDEPEDDELEDDDEGRGRSGGGRAPASPTAECVDSRRVDLSEAPRSRKSALLGRDDVNAAPAPPKKARAALANSASTASRRNPSLPMWTPRLDDDALASVAVTVLACLLRRGASESNELLQPAHAALLRSPPHHALSVRDALCDTLRILVRIKFVTRRRDIASCSNATLPPSSPRYALSAVATEMLSSVDRPPSEHGATATLPPSASSLPLSTHYQGASVRLSSFSTPLTSGHEFCTTSLPQSAFPFDYYQAMHQQQSATLQSDGMGQGSIGHGTVGQPMPSGCTSYGGGIKLDTKGTDFPGFGSAIGIVGGGGLGGGAVGGCDVGGGAVVLSPAGKLAPGSRGSGPMAAEVKARMGEANMEVKLEARVEAAESVKEPPVKRKVHLVMASAPTPPLPITPTSLTPRPSQGPDASVSINGKAKYRIGRKKSA